MINKIIRVSGCHSCHNPDPNYYTCYELDYVDERPVCVKYYFDNKIIHPDCPLDDEDPSVRISSEGTTLMSLLARLSIEAHGSELNIGNEFVDNAIEAIVLYLEESRSEYADYVLEKKTPQIRQDAVKHIRAAQEYYEKKLVTPEYDSISWWKVFQDAVKLTIKQADEGVNR